MLSELLVWRAWGRGLAVDGGPSGCKSRRTRGACSVVRAARRPIVEACARSYLRWTKGAHDRGGECWADTWQALCWG